jgi:predicted nucleic acid-binding protein
MVLADSSIWIEAARREGSLAVKVGLEGLLEEYETAWCGLVKLEVLGAARKDDRRRLARYFDCIPYLTLSDDIWDKAVQSSWKLRDNGLSIPWNDIVIGTMAMEHDCRAYAHDKHFRLMERMLGLRLYQPDYGGKFRPE